jgi:hypothetical protein
MRGHPTPVFIVKEMGFVALLARALFMDQMVGLQGYVVHSALLWLAASVSSICVYPLTRNIALWVRI